MLSPDEQRLIERLRKEAADVKDCFARYSFQTMTIVTPILGVIVMLQANRVPLVGLASIPVILLILTICRMGTHRYVTANRLNGFELHLHRLDSVPEDMRSPWDAKARTMGWEEGMRAWRVVQATMYGTLYDCRRWLPHKLKDKWSDEKGETRKHVWWRSHRPRDEESKKHPRWYEPNTLIGDAVYHMGRYLRTLLKVLYFVIAFAYACLLWSAIATWNAIPPLNWWLVWGIVLPTVMIMILCQIMRIQSFVTSLEKGIFSIHSCTLMWHAVAVAHARALQSVFAPRGGTGLKGYHREIGRLALELAENPLELHEWIYRKDKAAPSVQSQRQVLRKR